MTDIANTPPPPPTPSKDGFRPTTLPKDFPRTNFLDYASTSTVNPEDSNSTSNTFPGVKGTNKNLASTLDEIFVEPIAENTNKAPIHEPQVPKSKPTTTGSENVFTKISWWLSWGKLKPTKSHPSNNKINDINNNSFSNNVDGNNDNLITSSPPPTPSSSHSIRTKIPSSPGDNDPVVATSSDGILVAPAKGSSSSPEPSIKITDPVSTTDAKPDEPSKVKKSNSITNLFRRLSHRKRETEGSSSTVVAEEQQPSTTTNKFSTVPKAKVKSKKSGFGSLIERLNRSLSFSFANDHRDTEQSTSDQNQTNNEINDNHNTLISSKPPRIDWSLSSNNRRALKQKQKDDFTVSALFPDESSISTIQLAAAENSDSQNTNNKNALKMDPDVAASSRHSVTKSSISSERADDDTIRGPSGTARRRSHIFDIFNLKGSSQRGSILTRESQINVNQSINGVSLRHDMTDSNNAKGSSSLSSSSSSIILSSQHQESSSTPKNQQSPLNSVTNNMSHYSTKNSSNPNFDMRYNNMEITSRDNLTTTTDFTKANKTDKSPFRIFKKKFYKNLLTSHSSDVGNAKNKKHIPTANSIPTIVGTPPSPLPSPLPETTAVNRTMTTTDLTANNGYGLTNVGPTQAEHSSLSRNVEEEDEEGGSDKYDEEDDDDFDEIDDITLDDGVEGDVSAVQSQAQDSSLYTASDAASHSRSLSRMSSFAKSFNSEDPSAFGASSNHGEPSSDYSLENAWDALVNCPPSDDKGPARLSNSRLSHIPSHFFDGLHNLNELYLDRNSLSDLSEELLKLTKLETLDLSNNCISEIHPKLKLRRMKNLRRINLDNNVLSDITSISKLRTLRELRANNNLLSTITTDISKLVKLRLLYLDNNQLTSLPDAIGRLKSLCVLRLNNNNIETLPTSLCSLHQLQVLELRANLLTQLPENIKELEGLAKLDVSNNRLSSLPNDLVKCSRLTHLNVSSNQLESIPAKFGQLSRLLTLNLRDNKINNLPADMGKLTNLVELDLSFNELVVLPEDLGKLAKLTEIKLNNNPSLLAIPETFRKLLQIRKVHLQHCSLSQIPFEMGSSFSQLKHVNLSYNLFDTVPSLSGMDQVVTFDISNNRIDDLTPQIGQLEMLRELYAVNNKLTYLPKSIGRLQRLLILDVSENMLTELPLSIGDCQSLREIKLRGNSLDTLPITLRKLKNLNVFHIGQWPATEFNIVQEDISYENLKVNPYQHKILKDVERTLLWRMHDSILKKLRDLDNNNDATPERLSRSPSSESSNSQQDITTYSNNNNNNNNNSNNNGNIMTNTLDPQNDSSLSSQNGGSNSSLSQPIPGDDVVLKMAVLKGVYDQIMKDMKPNDYDKESSGEDTTEFPGNGKKKKFSKLKDKFLKIGDKQ